jgi:hypothetical protein
VADLHPVEAFGIILVPVFATLLAVSLGSIQKVWIRISLSAVVLWAGIEIYNLSNNGLELDRLGQAWAAVIGATFGIAGFITILVTLRMHLEKRFW